VAPAGALLLLLAYRPRAVARSLLGLALVLVVLVHFTSPGALGSVLSQLEPGHVGGVLTTTDRTARYDAVKPDVMRHLLLGRGFASYDPHKYRILDNEYLGLLIGTGVIGVAAYAAIFLTIISMAHGTVRGGGRRREGLKASSLALAALGCVGVVALASALFDVLSFPHVPYLLFFVAGMIVALRDGAPLAVGEATRGSTRRSALSARSPLGAHPDHRSPSSPPRTRRSPGAPAQPSPARLAGG
jgi:O-antigen ligase